MSHRDKLSTDRHNHNIDPAAAENLPPMSETRRSDHENARHFLAAIVDSSQDAIVTIDFDGIVTTWNKAAEQLYGYSAAEAIGHALLLLTLPQDLAQTLSDIEHVKQSQRVEIFDSIRSHKDGREMNLEVVMSPVRDTEGAVVGISIIARDATQRKEAEKLRAELVQKELLAAQRARMMQRIVNAQEEERKRISRELHDNMGQYLTAIQMGIQALQKENGADPAMERRASADGLKRLHEMIGELSDIAHRVAWDLRPATLDNLGLEAALQQYVNVWPGQGVTANFISRHHSRLHDRDKRHDRNKNRVAPEIETALYRIVQEALTNVLRHARCSHVNVILDHGHDQIRVIITDNGQGFDYEAETTRKRLGLLSMRERAELVGGTLEIESALGSGTTIFACVPLDRLPEAHFDEATHADEPTG